MSGIDEYIARMNIFFNSASTTRTTNNINESQPQSKNTSTLDNGKTKNKQNKPKSKQKQKKGDLLLSYNTIDQLESLCKRAVILHTEGVYVRPPEAHNCDKKKKRKRGGKKFDRGPNGKMPKTTFGSGSVGVSCESYGVKNCSCCAPRSNEDILFLQSLNKIHKNGYENDYIDLTDMYGIDQSSSSKKWDNSVINISDSSPNSLIMTPEPDEVIILDNFQFQTSDSETNVIIETETENTDIIINDTIKTENTDIIINDTIKTENTDIIINDTIKTENFAAVDNITDYINLVTEGYDEEENKKFEEELAESIYAADIESLSVIPNIKMENVPALVENITDYINLVTKDYDEEENKKFEEELEQSIYSADIESLSLIPENTMENVPKKDVPQIVTNEVKLPKTQANSQQIVEIIESPKVASKPPSSTSSPPGLTCPICLDSLIRKEVMSTICGHLFCAECIKEVIKKTKCCPNCRKKLTLKSIHPIYLG